MQVEALKYTLGRKLGRNLYRKLNTGPLGKERKSYSSIDRDRDSEFDRDRHRRVSSDSGITSTGEKYLVGHSALHAVTITERQKREQSQELSDIEDMGIVVRASDKIKNHIRNHVARFDNHRLMIRPHGYSDSRNKSSVLVTMDDGSEQQECQAREVYRQQSKVVMESFFQLPSHKQRVLEKQIANAEMGKTSRIVWKERKKKRRRSRLRRSNGMVSAQLVFTACYFLMCMGFVQ